MENRLTANHVETIRQIIAGAVAGIEIKDIVVTDLSNGEAYHSAQLPPAENGPVQQVANSNPLPHESVESQESIRINFSKIW